VIDDHDLASGCTDTFKLFQNLHGIGDDSHHIHCDDCIERGIVEAKIGSIHLVDARNVGEALFPDALPRDAQHVGGQIDPGDRQMRRITGQRDTCTDTDLQQRAFALIDDIDGALAPRIGDGTEGKIVNRRPARICLDDRLFVDPDDPVQNTAPRLFTLPL
jgi:hypothetical protein